MPFRRSSSSALAAPRSRSSWPSASAFFPSSLSHLPLPSPSLAAGFQFDSSIAEDPEPPQMDNSSSFQPFRPLPPSTPHLASTGEPDRLDRLLAEFDAQAFSSTVKIINKSNPSDPQPQDADTSSDDEAPAEHASESRLMSLKSSPMRRKRCECSNCQLSTTWRSRSSSEASGSGGSCEEAWPAVKVRFCEGAAQEVLTWSAETYDRKGPEPISRLSMREVIELKLIKQEVLGLGSQV